MNPIETIESKLADMEQRLRIAVETGFLREQTRWLLSRLSTLDPERAPVYAQMLQEIGEG